MYINSENQIDVTEVRAIWNSFNINMGVYFIGHQSHWKSLIYWKESKKSCFTNIFVENRSMDTC